jgi:hypothetical protein
MKSTPLTTWVFFRLPFLGVIVYLFRFQFTEIIESTVGLEKVAEFIVYSASTFSIRAILFMGGVVFLGMLKWSINKLALSTKGKHILNAGITFIVIFLCFRYLLLLPDHILIKTFLVTAILFANTLPHEMLATIDPRKNHIHTFVIYGIGFAELLTPQIYLLWLADRFLPASNHQSKLRDSSWITGVVAAVLLWVFLLIPHENQRIFTLGEKLNYDPAVEKFAEGDFNWLEINSERRELYAVGPGLNFIMIFNMD